MEYPPANFSHSLAMIELRIALSQVVLNFNPVELVDKDIVYVDQGGLTSPTNTVQVILEPVVQTGPSE